MNAPVHYDPTSDAYTTPLDQIDVSDPRLFQDDIYPPATGSKPAMSSAEWLDGKSARPAKIDMGDMYDGTVARVRELAPTLPLLIPGIGAQGGDAAAAVSAGWRADAQGRTVAPIIVSSSRAVLYASRGDDFAQASRDAALAAREQLNVARRAASGGAA